MEPQLILKREILRTMYHLSLIMLFCSFGFATEFKTHRTYLVVTGGIVTKALLDERGLINRKLADLRTNNDGTKTIVKFVTASGRPAALSVAGVTAFTHEEMLAEIENAEWQDPD